MIMIIVSWDYEAAFSFFFFPVLVWFSFFPYFELWSFSKNLYKLD